MNCVLMETLWRGRLGVLHRTKLLQLRRPDPPLEFPGEHEIFLDMYTQVREEEQIISPPFTRSQEDVSMRRRKKRKQVEDSALIG